MPVIIARRASGNAVRRGRPLGAAVLLGLLAAASSTVLPSCGARTELEVGPFVPPKPECDVDSDCPGHDDKCNPITCVNTKKHADDLPPPPDGTVLPIRVCYGLHPVNCDDGDECTNDLCNSQTGQCSWEPATLDLDGDGHRGPLPGHKAGDPGSCGDDCDDTNPEAYPGHPEVCDGVDNDCNGIIDDGATWTPLLAEPVRISGDNLAPAEPGGLAWDGQSYLTVYSGTTDGFDMYETRLDGLGNKVDPIEQQIALQNADSYGGPLTWIGDRYGLGWEDRRDGEYEIYFTLLDRLGAKMIPDVRLTHDGWFSINPDMTWDGTNFILAWQDDRYGLFQILAQLVDVNGVPLGDNVSLTQQGAMDDESPSIAAGIDGFGMAFTNGVAGFHLVRFGIFDLTTLQPKGDIIQLTDGSTESVYPVVEWNRDHYIVAWFDRTGPTKAIFGTTLSADGTIIVPPTALTSPGTFNSRYPHIKALGDRSLLLYADDRDQNNGYELYARMFAPDLSPMGSEQRLTNAPYDSIWPIAAFGPNGDLGVLFRDDRLNGAHHVWFTRLGCVQPPTP